MPYIAEHFIEKILDDCQLEKIIGDFVELKKAGANLQGESPFVEEQTPSFIVSPVKQIWKCFSSGKGGNNAISFLMAKDMSYPEALDYIAKKQGRSIEYQDTKQAKAYQEKQVKIQGLRPVLNRAIATYKKELEGLAEDHPAKIEVFFKRQYNQEIVDTYGIGYAPGNKFLYDKLKQAAVVKQGEDVSLLNGTNDFYYNRVTYTIYDKNGEAVGIAGRELKDPPKVKWLNSRSTTLYAKDYTWYGLHIAKAEIRKTNAVYVVEGYNDVIGFQTNGLLNTIAPCGTSIHDNQINELTKYAETVYFAMDGDKAGKKSALKNIPRFIEAGLHCYVVAFKDCDPDDFTRLHSETLKTKTLVETLEAETTIKDGFNLLLEPLQKADDVTKAVEAKKLCELISKIEDDTYSGIYLKWLSKESKVSVTELKKWVKEFIDQRTAEAKERYIASNEYELPKDVTMTKEIEDDIKRYQMFQANNKIYSQIGYEFPIKFSPCSNFSVNIIQHMRDEDFPKKLVSAENTVKENFVFDVPSDTFNVSAMFQKAMTNFGNFRWHGRSDDLVRLQALLFDKMGNGRSIDVLGWQHEGFFLFNNLVVVPGGTDIDLDKNGCFEFKGISYYVPSANVIYATNPYKYMPQKQFRHIPGTVSANEYFSKVHRVHGNHAISSIFHAIACMFHDIVVKSLKGFPINFSYGPPGTGKDELNHAVKSLWGIPQVATNLEGKNATKTATIRELAQFTNALLEWSEYSRGDSELDGTIKSVWDLRGKKIGQRESRVATDNVPVLSGISLTGNEYPDNAAIITRIIWNDMNRTDFTEADEHAFNELNDLIEDGLTHITVKILKLRDKVQANFNRHYRDFMDVYQRRIPDCNKRMLKNISTLTAFYQILKDDISFPFSQEDILSHFETITVTQMRKLTSSSIIVRWWDCFIESMKGVDHDKIKVGREMKLEGELLYFQFTKCFNKITRQWFTQYKDAIPNKGTMMEAIEKDEAFHEFKKVVDYKSGSPRIQSSAIVINLLKLPEDLQNLLKSEINIQSYNMPAEPFSPEPPLNKDDNEDFTDDNSQQDIPF